MMALIGGRDYGREGSMDAQAHRRAHQGPTLSVEREVPACAPGDMLIDDLENYRHLWISKGGPLDHSSLGSRNNPNASGNGSALSFVFGSSIPTCRSGTVSGICAKNGKLNASFLANVNISEAIHFLEFDHVWVGGSSVLVRALLRLNSPFEPVRSLISTPGVVQSRSAPH
jgi:hypothetical protein